MDRKMATLVEHGIFKASTSDGRLSVFGVSEKAWKYLQEHPDSISTPNQPRPKPTGRDFMSS
jgi:hypothetical protein